jgi:hypothetical protein
MDARQKPSGMTEENQMPPQPFKQRRKIYLPDINPDFPNHTWTFWASPTIETLIKMNAPFAILEKQRAGTPPTDEEQGTAEDRYFEAVADLVLDTGESAIDLSTPDRVRAAFGASGIDTELLAGVVNTWIDFLLRERESAQKKASAPSMPTGA